MRKPSALSARTADSRPGPGPRTRTSTFFTPNSSAARPAFSDATCAANGVDFRPGNGVALPVGDRDDRVIEGSIDVRDSVDNVLFDLLLFYDFNHI